MGKYKKQNIVLFIGPALLIYLAFIVYPFISSIRYSFYNWDGFGPLTQFIGFKNFTYVLFSHTFSPFLWRAIVHNLYFFGISMVLTLIFGLGVAYFLIQINEKTSRWFQTIFFIPLVIPPVVLAYLWSIYLEPNYGVVSTILGKLQIPFLNVPFLGSHTLALPTIAVITAWAGMGFPIMIFLASLMNVPKDLLEAAKIDGASSSRSFFSVTFPLIKPTILTIATLNFIGSFATFDLIYIMEGTQAGPGYATDVLGTLFYRTAFGGFGTTAQGLGLATALAVVGFGIVMIASGIFVYLQNKALVE